MGKDCISVLMGNIPESILTQVARIFGFKRYPVKAFFIRSISLNAAPGNCICSEAVGRLIPTLSPNFASSSVRIFFGE